MTTETPREAPLCPSCQRVIAENVTYVYGLAFHMQCGVFVRRLGAGFVGAAESVFRANVREVASLVVAVAPEPTPEPEPELPPQSAPALPEVPPLRLDATWRIALPGAVCAALRVVPLQHVYLVASGDAYRMFGPSGYARHLREYAAEAEAEQVRDGTRLAAAVHAFRQLAQLRRCVALRGTDEYGELCEAWRAWRGGAT